MTINRRWCVNMVYTIMYYASVKQEWGTYYILLLIDFLEILLNLKKKQRRYRNCVGYFYLSREENI